MASVTLAAPSPASAFTVITGWHTPNWAVNCEVTVPDGGLIQNSILECWTPNDGFYVTMSGQSKATKGYRKHLKGHNDREWAIG